MGKIKKIEFQKRDAIGINALLKIRNEVVARADAELNRQLGEIVTEGYGVIKAPNAKLLFKEGFPIGLEWEEEEI